VSGPLRGTELVTVNGLTTTWGEWRAEHPGATVISPATGPYDRASLEQTRDAAGPIFPVGEIDDRAAAQTRVLGVVGPNGPVAFPMEAARAALRAGRPVASAGVTVTLVAGGLVATTSAGAALPATEGYWFAWSHRHPATALWAPSG
jgi:hypothetical protein